MRSYALFLALAVLHARAASIPAPQTEKKLPIATGALDDVSLDNNESEQELVQPTDTVKEIGNDLRNGIPEKVPVEIIEEQPIVKKITIKEDSNDYVPDNDDSSNIKRVEIDLKNPGPPQRQEHDSQNPTSYHSYVDKERAVAAIKQSIEESQNIFTRGIQDVTKKFEYYFANNDELNEVSKNIESLRKDFDNEVVKLGNTINSYLKPENVKQEAVKNVETPSGVKDVANGLKNLETNFNYGVGLLSEGVELLSILKEEDDENLKIAGKADNENVAATGTATGTAPANPAAGSSPTASNPVIEYLQNFNASVFNAFTNLQNTIQNFWSQNQNQNQSPSSNTTSQGGFNPASFFQGINFPNIFQQNQNQNPQQAQGTAPAGAQADDAGTTERPNILQQIQSTFQNIVNPAPASQQQTQPSQNPITQFISGVNQGITNFFQPKPQQPPTQTGQLNVATGQSAASAPATPAASEGTNSVPAASAQVEPVKPAQEFDPVQSAPAPSASVPNGPIQQIVQNNPIVKGISNAVQKIQDLASPTKPKDPVVENSASKGHGSGGAHNGDSVSGVEDIKSGPANDETNTIPDIKNSDEPAAEINKTE